MQSAGIDLPKPGREKDPPGVKLVVARIPESSVKTSAIIDWPKVVENPTLSVGSVSGDINIPETGPGIIGPPQFLRPEAP